VCHDCDALQDARRVRAGGVAKCYRCGAILARIPTDQGIERAVALLVASLILFIVANVFPILTMELQGYTTEATVLGAVRVLYLAGEPLLSVVVMLTALVLPLIQLLGMLVVLVPFLARRRHRFLKEALHVVEAVGPWSMIEIMMLGVLVSLVKLAGLAHVIPGAAMWAYGLLILSLASSATAIEPHALWDRLERL